MKIVLEQPLTIDLNQETASQHLPGLPLLSSYRAGWNGIHLEYHHQPPLTIPDHSLKRHLICICLNRSVTVERVVDGYSRTEHLTAGSCSILPAHMQHRASCDRPAEFVLLSLEPTLLQATVELTHTATELVPQFAKSDPLIYQIGLALKTELQFDESGGRLYADGMAQALAVHLTRHYSGSSESKQTIANYTDGLPKYKLKQAIDYIIGHLDQEISLASLAAELQISPFHFARLFKQSTGISPHQYVTCTRIDRAKQLLTNPDLEIIDIGQEVGFKTQSHFTAVFRRAVGISPKAYRDGL